MGILSRISATTVLLITVVLARPAAAEPIVVTSGHVETQIFLGLARVLFEGDGFSLRVGVDGFRAPLALDCTPCTPGSAVNLGGAFDFPRAVGSALVDGVAYAEIFVDGMTGTFTTPSIRIDGSTTTTIALPFSYSGIVSGYVLDPFVHGPTEAAFTRTLVGSGTASATFLFTDTEGPLFTANDLRYDFDGAAPVPEPATLLLSAFGTAVVAVRRRRALGERHRRRATARD